MTQKWTDRNLPGALHFVTANVKERRPIFRRAEACRAFLEELRLLKQRRECKIVAFVVMPDHVHLVVNPRDGRVREWMGALKSLAARRLMEVWPRNFFFYKEGFPPQVWQESFQALPLSSEWTIWQKINYIHHKPLKAGLADSAKDYRWSSFRGFYRMETEEILQVDQEWWWDDDARKLPAATGECEKELKGKYKKGK